MTFRVAMCAWLVAAIASPRAWAAEGEAIASGISPDHAYEFDLPMECGKHLLPPSVCYPKPIAFSQLNSEIQRLQAIEKTHNLESGRLTFLVAGLIMGLVTGALLGGFTAWELLHH